jgi:hypothetical protein
MPTVDMNYVGFIHTKCEDLGHQLRDTTLYLPPTSYRLVDTMLTILHPSIRELRDITRIHLFH